MMKDLELDYYTVTISLGLDGYDNQKDHDNACLEEIKQQLDRSYSSIMICTEPMIKVSELREWVQNNYFYSKEKGSLLIEAYDLLAQFCGGEK